MQIAEDMGNAHFIRTPRSALEYHTKWEVLQKSGTLNQTEKFDQSVANNDNNKMTLNLQSENNSNKTNDKKENFGNNKNSSITNLDRIAMAPIEAANVLRALQTRVLGIRH